MTIRHMNTRNTAPLLKTFGLGLATLAVLTGGVIAPPAARSQDPATVDFISNTGTGGLTLGGTDNGYSNVIGWRIDVGALPLAVTALGSWDPTGSGLPSDTRVGLWRTSDATLLGQVVVTAGANTPTNDGFRFADLTTPLLLLPNTSYTLGERIVGPNGQEFILRYSQNVVFASGDATFVYAGMYDTSQGSPTSTDFATQMPVTNLGDTAPLMGPNFQFTAAPEPSQWASLGLGALGLAGLGWKARKRA